jgi:hypothetical protein
VGGALVWLQNSAKDGDARFEECGLGVVGVAETLTIGILGRPVEVMQLVEIVEEVQSKVQ